MNTRIYRNIIDSEGNAITGQVLVAVKSGDSPSSSPSAVNGSEVLITSGWKTVGTGSYYFDISEAGLWDIYLSTGGVFKIYQERQWVGGPASGGIIGFTVYECVSPIPNDGGYYIAEFPAVGLSSSLPMTVAFPTPGVMFDAGFGIQRDMASGKIVVKISAHGVGQGAHIAYFTQGSTNEYRTSFRIVDVASKFGSPIYNFIKNPEFSLGQDDLNPPNWISRSYLTSVPIGSPPSNKTAKPVMSVIESSGRHWFRMKLTGSVATDAAYYKIQPNDVLYTMQFVDIGQHLTQPRRMTVSLEANIANIGDMSMQMSLVAISRGTSESVLAETTPNTITSSPGGVRHSKVIDAPIGTNVIKVVIALANRKGAALPAAGEVDYYLDFTKVKLCSGNDSVWYS